jgi:hypothetical protein
VTARIDISEYLREYHETGEIVLRGKWSMDGAESLAEAAQLLRHFADELDALADAGFHLMDTVEDDHGFAHRAEAPVTRSAERQEDHRLRQVNEDSAQAPEPAT